MVEFLKEHGFTHYSSRDFIVAEIKQLGLPIDRNQMRLTGNELRAEHGNEFVVRQALEKAVSSGDDNVVIESLRAEAEAEYLKAQRNFACGRC